MMSRETAKKYFQDLLGVSDLEAWNMVDEYVELCKKRGES